MAAVHCPLRPSVVRAVAGVGVSVLAVVLVLLCGVSGQQLSGVPLVQPVRVFRGEVVELFAAADGGLAAPPVLYVSSEDSENTLLTLDATGSVVMQSAPTSDWFQFYDLEPRPHLGMLWGAASSCNCPYPIMLVVGFNSSSLEHVTTINTTALSPAFNTSFTQWALATDSRGRVYVNLETQVWIMDPNGTQVGYFDVPESAPLPILYNRIEATQWYIALDPSVWLLNGNGQVGNSSFYAVRTTAAGELLNAGVVSLPISTNFGFSVTEWAIESFAVDSAGVAYVSVYANSTQPIVVYKFFANFSSAGVVMLPRPAGQPESSVQLLMTISWGPTPALDALFVYEWSYYSPVYEYTTSGSLVASIETNPLLLYQTGPIAYDPKSDGMLFAEWQGPEVLRLMNRSTGATLQTFNAGIAGEFTPYPSCLSVAADGHGLLVCSNFVQESDFGAVKYHPYDFDLGFFQAFDEAGNTLATIVAGAGWPISSAIAVDPTTSLVWVAALTDELYYYYATVLQAWNVTSGALVQNYSVPNSPSQMHYVAGAGGRPAAIWLCDGGPSLTALDVLTGATSTVYVDTTGSIFILDFALSPNEDVLYVVSSVTLDPANLLTQGTFVVAVRLSDGQILAELDMSGLGSGGTILSTYLAVDSDGQVWVPGASSFINVFAPVELPSGSALGDPAFTGLRGQQFQVHGLDGAVYNLITDSSYNVNSRFVFLDGPRHCPVLPTSGQHSAACWSHPGSYLTNLAVVTSAGDRVLVQSGPAARGFTAVTVNSEALAVGEEAAFSNGRVLRLSSHEVQLTVGEPYGSYSLLLENSDAFLNVRSFAVEPAHHLGRLNLTSHGLLGQTHSRAVHRSTLRVIEGEVDDYVVVDGEWGRDFVFNRMQLQQGTSVM